MPSYQCSSFIWKKLYPETYLEKTQVYKCKSFYVVGIKTLFAMLYFSIWPCQSNPKQVQQVIILGQLGSSLLSRSANSRSPLLCPFNQPSIYLRISLFPSFQLISSLSRWSSGRRSAIILLCNFCDTKPNVLEIPNRFS